MCLKTHKIKIHLLHHWKHHEIHHRHSIRGNFSLIDFSRTYVKPPIAPADDALWPIHSTILPAHGISLSLASIAIFVRLLADGIASSNDVAMPPYWPLFPISFENAVIDELFFIKSEMSKNQKKSACVWQKKQKGYRNRIQCIEINRISFWMNFVQYHERYLL